MALIHLAPTAFFQRVGTETVILDSAAGQFFELNEMATLMVELLLAGSTRQELLQQITTRYQVDPAVVESDLERLLQELCQRQLLLPVS
jgi:hypothetical protein